MKHILCVIALILFSISESRSVQSAPSKKSVIQTIGSNAVFKARALNAVLNPGVVYDDIGVCNSVGVFRNGNNLQSEENEINGVKINVYPNPTRGQITFDYKLTELENGTIEICDLLGKKLQTIELNNKAQRITTNLDFAKGLYFAKYIVNNELLETHKVVIK